MTKRGAGGVRSDSQRKRALRNRIVIDAAKNRPCLDCGGIFPLCAMDFDHVHGKKQYALGQMGGRRIVSLKTLLGEIEKCDVVCANCHRIREVKRRHV